MTKIESERLILRALQTADSPEIFSLRSDRQVNAYLDRDPIFHPEEALAFIATILNAEPGPLHYWAICLKGEAKLIGTICLWNFSADRKSAELGFELNPSFWAKGYMREAVDIVIQFAFGELGLQFIEAGTHSENKASGAVLLKSGFVLKHIQTGTVPREGLTYILHKQA
jgi:ribosomal-protein-alanine N-acetyltransferase